MDEYGDDSWFYDIIGIDPSTLSTRDEADLPSNEQILADIGYEDPGVVDTVMQFLSSAGKGALNYLTTQFPKTGGGVNWGAVASTAGGLLSAYDKLSGTQSQPRGYQGGIPSYTAVREVVPGSQYDPNRRPGSGGMRYFSDVKYAAPGEATTAARAAAKEEAAGLAALNAQNPAREARPTPTAVAAEQGAQSDLAREGRAPSEVIRTNPVPTYAHGGYAHGGISALAKGGEPRYLNGASDGMEDKVPARIDNGQEARLSHGEFVIPADVVSHLGNGNSEAGAQRLYSMMDRIRKARTGTPKQGKQINPNKFLPS